MSRGSNRRRARQWPEAAWRSEPEWRSSVSREEGEVTGRPVLPTLAGVLVVGAIAGCEEGPDPANWPEQLAYGVRDSAGVTIVASASPATGSRLEWRVGPEPRVSVGAPTTDEDYQLYEVGDASRLADGRIVVANGGSNQVLVFDHAGNYLAAWAGQGEGPGEFRSLGLVESWTADSLIAADSEQGRVSIFDLEGNHGRTTTLMGEPGWRLKVHKHQPERTPDDGPASGRNDPDPGPWCSLHRGILAVGPCLRSRQRRRQPRGVSRRVPGTGGLLRKRRGPGGEDDLHHASETPVRQDHVHGGVGRSGRLWAQRDLRDQSVRQRWLPRAYRAPRACDRQSDRGPTGCGRARVSCGSLGRGSQSQAGSRRQRPDGRDLPRLLRTAGRRARSPLGP
ncbi:MAG: 6-bladed beta-propeller [Gemmatimonadetes bacterium]|nr:6-bladed beta-propeller [Gemmatimonadota bacterium]MYE91938.1 6-bladed beta-propeller [Gemmatimonadota bacterium]MYJ11626.1 6-bladed beta-propeller [Gemmatimonadota bacterium]